MGDRADLAGAREAARSHLASDSRQDRLAKLLELAAADNTAGVTGEARGSRQRWGRGGGTELPEQGVQAQRRRARHLWGGLNSRADRWARASMCQLLPPWTSNYAKPECKTTLRG